MKSIKNILLISILFLSTLVYSQVIYKVQAGDTFYGIRKTYNLSIEEIIRLNPQITGHFLKSGDIIHLSDSKISIYEVQPKETIYGLSMRFGISQEELLRLNPDIKNGLKIGIILHIPTSNEKNPNLIKPNYQKVLKILPQKTVRHAADHLGDGFIRYLVKRNDTLSSIIHNYKLDFTSLIRYNPKLTYELLKSGMTLKIPINIDNKDTTLADTVKQTPLKERLNIVILLPLNTKNISEKYQKLSQYATDFYSGSKSAIDLLSLKRPIHVKLFDTENNKKKVDFFLNTYDFSQVHAVIAPFFQSSVEQIAKALKKQNIPVISPIVSSECLDIYPNVIQAEVRDQFLADPIIKEIKNSLLKIQKIYLFNSHQEKTIEIYLRNQLLKWCSKLQILSVDKLPEISINTPPFITILISDKLEIGNNFIKNIKCFKPGKLFPLGIGYNPVYYNNLIWLKNYGIVFTMKYHVNKHTEIGRKAMKILGINDKKIPDKYKLLGFDVLYDIIERLIENKKLLQSIDANPRSRVANKFQYEKIYKGGYINKGVWIVRFKS